MTPYAATIVTPEALGLFHRAERLVAAIPDGSYIDGHPIRCHEVARAVGKILGLKVVDGLCGAVQHSWLVLPAARGEGERDFILDPYAVGRLPPVQLVDTFYGTLNLADKGRRRHGDGGKVYLVPRTGLYLPQRLRVHIDVPAKHLLVKAMRQAEAS